MLDLIKITEFSIPQLHHLSVSQCIKNLKAIYREVCGFYSMMRQYERLKV